MLEQMIYASRASFRTRAVHEGVEPEVGRILMESQRNNGQRGLVGGLYFGDGHFFQCLEGETEAIDGLQAALARDPRHRDMKVLRRRPIEHPTFERWSM